MGNIRTIVSACESPQGQTILSARFTNDSECLVAECAPLAFKQQET